MESHTNDIALVRLVNRIYFSANVAPACLQLNMRDEGSNVKLIETGWTSTEPGRKSSFQEKFSQNT